MSVEAQREITKYLDAGELLKWSGVPSRALVLRVSDMFMVPASFVVSVFVLSTAMKILTSDAPLLLRLLAVPMVISLLHFTVGRFFTDAWRRSRIFYGLTGKRVIIVSGSFSKIVKTLPLRAITEITLNQRSNGSGTIYFGFVASLENLKVRSKQGLFTEPEISSFELIQNAKEVYDQVREAIDAAD